MTLLNMINHTYVNLLSKLYVPFAEHAYRPYFVRFSKLPIGADLAAIQTHRMATEGLLRTDDPQDTVGEMCQFLSTLLVIYDLKVSATDRDLLVPKLVGWIAGFRGYFAEQTAQRCLDILRPQTY